MGPLTSTASFGKIKLRAHIPQYNGFPAWKPLSSIEGGESSGRLEERSRCNSRVSDTRHGCLQVKENRKTT